ncbi:MAG TPA: COR domain-containing protein, partial [Leptospiraceae bacterium]|nr:COR domain-containing protein [Leptospiraceae bacterium]
MSRDTEIIERLKTEYKVTDKINEYKDFEKEKEIYYQYSSDRRSVLELRIQNTSYGEIIYTEKLENLVLQMEGLEVLELSLFFEKEIQFDARYSVLKNLKELSLGPALTFTSNLLLVYKNMKSIFVSNADNWDLFFEFLKRMHQTSLENLDLSGKDISTLPTTVSELRNLKHLNLSWCKELSSLPEWIGDLPLLEILDVSNTRISTLPASASKLKNLKSLNFSDCEELNSLPDWIGELSALENLTLFKTKISMFPASVSELKNLKNLNLSGCDELNSLPDWIGELSLLEILDVSNTRISKLPSSVSKLKNLKDLNLYGCNELNSLPEWIGQLSSLEFLSLSSAKISNLPSSISKLKNLKILSLFWCKELTALPESIGELSLLETLGLTYTKINTLPSSFSQLKRLKNLTLSDCKELNSLPEDIGELSSLEDLVLSGTKISILPDSFSQLKNLKSLSLSEELTFLPETIGKLSSLKFLNLRNTKVSTLPSFLNHLKNIKRIDLLDSCISVLPEWITDFDLPILYDEEKRVFGGPGINLTGNPIETPPLEIVKQGNQAIKEYFRQIREQGVDVLYESKLIIVGEGGSGKTTLSKKLQNHSLLLPETESTLGVEVNEGLQFTHSEDENIQIAVNVWDFGGQEIQYQLHQFFFSPNALYIIVADNRTQDTRWDYWFHIIHLLGGKCNVFVIMNNKKTVTNISNFKRDRYIEEFSDLKITEVSADFSINNDDWDYVLKTMKKVLSNLPSVRKEVPRLWKKLRELINEEREKSKYIKFDDFLKKAKEIGIKSEADATSALKYFHDIGIILYFPKDITLRLVVFLDPNWITQGLYSALSGENSEVQNGCFTQDWIDGYWAKMNYTMEERTYLLQLMLKDNFDVCFKIDTGKFIVPMLLNDCKPSYEWDSKDNLHFRYEYPFLPKGMISRLIVRMHHIVSGNLIWQDGAVFELKSVQAEVTQKSDTKTGLKYIGIRISGKNLDEKRELLSSIRYEIESIHDKSFNGIRHSKIVFCNCSKCQNAEAPYPFEYDEIMEYIQVGKPNIECRKLKD